jgi:hypothetical protein
MVNTQLELFKKFIANLSKYNICHYKNHALLTPVKETESALMHNTDMKTTSEIAIVAVVWSMTSIGMFFSCRALLRKFREKLRRRKETNNSIK